MTAKERLKTPRGCQGVAPVTMPSLGWSVHMTDFDNDGWLDLFEVNGHVYPEVDTRSAGSSYRQRAIVFHNLRNGKFAPMNILDEVYAGRGAAVGDFDNDGAPDILINSIDGGPVLLKTKSTSGAWLDVWVRRKPIGARIYVRAGDLIQMREITSSSGYLSSSSRWAHFGLAALDHADEVKIVWPGGKRKSLKNVRANQRLVIED